MTDISLSNVAPRRQWITDFSSGIIIGFVQVITALSVATLIFSTPQALPYLPYGVAMVLITVLVHLFVMGVLVPSKRIVTKVQDNVSVLLGLAAAQAYMVVPQDQVFATLFAIIFVTTLLVGVGMFLIGYFRLGDLMRYVPYPVIGGFLAGGGWLLAQGAITSMTNLPFDLVTLLQQDVLLQWVPGVLYGTVLFFAIRQIKHFLTMPVMIVLGLVLFHLVRVFAGLSIDEAIARNLLIGNLNAGVAFYPLPLDAVANANWGAILSQSGNLTAIFVLTVIMLLLGISGIEIVLRKDLDLNHELRASGIANILSALLGGVLGYRSISLTTLNHRLGARGHATNIITFLICGAVLLLGAPLLVYVPKAMLGGLLLFIGLSQLDDWVFSGLKKFSTADFVVVLIILVVIVSTGFLEGLVVGLLLMVASFLVNYSRLNIFQHVLSGSETSSNVLRNPHHRNVLRQEMSEAYILKLQGYLFFGTANKILWQLQTRLHQDPPLRFLVLDFKRVSSLDSSAVFSVNKIAFLAESKDFLVVFCNLTPAIKHSLNNSGLAFEGRFVERIDLDRALEFCETSILEREQVTSMHIVVTLPHLLYENGFSKVQIEEFKGYTERVRLLQGDVLFSQGQSSDAIYFLEVGQVSIYLGQSGEKNIRLQTLTMGNLVGELGFQLQMVRTASVVADTETWLYKLSRESLALMEKEDPQLTLLLKDVMLRVIGERLRDNNTKLSALEAL